METKLKSAPDSDLPPAPTLSTAKKSPEATVEPEPPQPPMSLAPPPLRLAELPAPDLPAAGTLNVRATRWLKDWGDAPQPPPAFVGVFALTPFVFLAELCC